MVREALDMYFREHEGDMLVKKFHTGHVDS